MQGHGFGVDTRNLVGGCGELDRERAWLVRAKRSHEHTAVYSRGVYRLLLSVHLACRRDRNGKRHSYVALRLAIEFNQAHDEFVAVLSLLQSQEPYPRIADLQQ